MRNQGFGQKGLFAALFENLHGHARRFFRFGISSLGEQYSRARLIGLCRAAFILQVKKQSPRTVKGLMRFVEPLLGGIFAKIGRDARDGMQRALDDLARTAGPAG